MAPKIWGAAGHPFLASPHLGHRPMNRSTGWLVGWGVIALALFIQTCRFERTKNELRSARLTSDSLQAVAETQVTQLRGNLRIVQRQVVQTQLQRDSLDRLLRAKRPVSRVGAVVTIRSVDTVLVGEAADSTGRQATFEAYHPPYSIVAQASLPIPPETPQLRLAIRLDTIPLGLRLGCTPGKGIQSAYAAITSPIWAQVNLVALTQDPLVCNPVKPTYGFRIPVLGVRFPWWATALGTVIIWETIR